MLYSILAISVTINVYLLFYARWLLRNVSQVDEDLDILYETFENFKTHVEGLHETEMFYGDSSLQHLISHSRLVLEQIDNYGKFLNEQKDKAETEDG